MNLLFIGNLGSTELILIVLVLLLMFGGKKLPELMRGAGKGIKEFKDSMNGVMNDDASGVAKTETKSPAAAETKSEDSAQIS